jgi:transmembrane sensor
MKESHIDHDKLYRFFIGKYSEKDAKYVNEVFCDKNKELELKSFLSKQFEDLLPENEEDKKYLDQILYKIHYDINTRLSVQNVSSFDKIAKWTVRIAAIIMLPLAILFGLQVFKVTALNKEAWVEIKAPAWIRAQFTLPDGTSGWLNSNSSLKYRGNFTKNRQVYLQGEALFDVKKNKHRPFVVNTNDVDVKVLGTRFNIASYESEEYIEIVLEEGELLLDDKKTAKSYTMSPNELIIYDKEHNAFTSEVVQPQKYLSWTDGKLIFRNDPLDVIARKLERWYNIEVGIKGNIPEDLRLRATFIDESLDEVLKILKLSLPIDYIIEKQSLGPDDTYTKKKVIISLKNI